MDLSTATTEELRRELHKREEAERQANWHMLCERYACPECGADPTDVETKAIEEFRFAPRDDEGQPMIYAPYDSEQGITGGLRYRTTVTCENGHVTEHDAMKWFDEPHKGPPILSAGSGS